MITFLEGQTYYAVPNTTYLSDIFEAGPYNKIVIQRVDECPVGPVLAELSLTTADGPGDPAWIGVGAALPVGLSTRTGLGKLVRLLVDVQARATAWQVAFAYNVDQLVSAASKVWTCLLDHTSSVEEEPEGTGSLQADWVVSFSYSEGELCQVDGNGICYYCIQTHTSSADDKPGAGANWQTYWMLNYLRYWAEYSELLHTKLSVYGKLVAD